MNKKSETKTKKRNKKESGQAMVEFALLLPVLLLILCGILDFGWLLNNQLALNNACRQAARYAVVNSTIDVSPTLSPLLNENDYVELVEDEIEDQVNNYCAGQFAEPVETEIKYSKSHDQWLEGDVTVTLTTKMHVLTPVLSAIVGGMEKELTATVTMKVES